MSEKPPATAPQFPDDNDEGVVPELEEYEEHHRETEGTKLGLVVMVLGLVIGVVHILFNTIYIPADLPRNAVHFGLFALLCVLINPMLKTKGKQTEKLVFIIDIIFGLIVAYACFHLATAENDIYDRGVKLFAADWVFGAIVLLGALELTRRTTGWIIPFLIVFSLTYAGWWGAYVEGIFAFKGLSLETILFRSIYSDEGIFGFIARISSTFVFMFILFGAFLVRSGAGDFVVDLGRAVAGKFIGGPGFVAVIASGLTGTISGSAVANTASTGVITIPLMKKAGFGGRFAAGVEASASTGGQLMPPIMGAGAIVMASFTEIPYTTIVTVSFLPALLYFGTIAFFVRCEAKRLGIRKSQETVKVGEVFRKGGILLAPVGLLVVMLVAGFTPTYAAGYAILAVIGVSWLTPNRMGPKAILEAMVMGSRNMVTTAVLLCAVGLVVNVIAMTAAGNTFSLMIVRWSGDSLVIAITLIALASLVLGMGLPVTAAYIILATLSAPALYGLIADGQLVDILVSGAVPEAAKAVLLIAAPDAAAQIGQPMSPEMASSILANIPVDLKGALREQMLSPEAVTFALLSAHMIIFWLSQDSNVTPPVCLTAFTAAAIAKTKPMATGVMSWKIAKGLYIVPLLFAYTPFLGGEFFQVMQIFLFALIGLYAFSGAFQGYMEGPLSWPLRGAMMVCSVLLMWPYGLEYNIGGLILFGVLFFFNVKAGKAIDAQADAAPAQ